MWECRTYSEAILHLKSLTQVTYNKWVRRGNIYEKAILCESGMAVADQFDEIVTKHFKLHVYNIFWQYYVKGCNTDFNFKSNIDKDTGLTVIPVVIVSNQTVHERNTAFSCNVLLIDFIKNHFPSVEKVHFWSDGCSSQFRSQYVFCSFSYFPRNLELT